MLEKLNLEDVLFLDIETVPQQKKYKDVKESLKKLWDKKAGFLARNEETPEELYERAGIYAEFGKIICISVGFIHRNEVRIKSFSNHDEHKLLTDFVNMIEHSFSGQHQLLCAHNGKEFDFPYIARRLLIQGLKIPYILNSAGKKPWEIQHIDTMELWKFGDFKNFTSLALLAEIFDIPTPKDDIDGSQVAHVYYVDNDLERIKVYCEKDVIALIQLLRRYRGEELFQDNEIMIVDQ